MSQQVFILGGAGGIGSALARRIVASGGRVFLAGRDAGRLATVAVELGAAHGTVDATDADAVDACVDRAAIACCAGSLLLKPAHLTTAAEWQATLAANLTTAFGCVRAAGRLLKPDGGSVVLVSSAAARIGLANHEAIAAAKAGIVGLVLSAAATYARHRIRFNAVAPGLTRTPLTQGLVASELAEKASIGMHPLGRLGTPDDVARAIEFLLDPGQDWITGQVLGVDGGLASLKTRP
jgi:NAD(P)-dependent dehydrogenase (short-subunit alcohol dehydrogenase family)